MRRDDCQIEQPQVAEFGARRTAFAFGTVTRETLGPDELDQREQGKPRSDRRSDQTTAQTLLAPFSAITDEQWNNLINVNLTGPIEFSKRLIAAKRGGMIVNIASITGQLPKSYLSASGTRRRCHRDWARCQSRRPRAAFAGVPGDA